MAVVLINNNLCLDSVYPKIIKASECVFIYECINSVFQVPGIFQKWEVHHIAAVEDHYRKPDPLVMLRTNRPVFGSVIEQHRYYYL